MERPDNRCPHHDLIIEIAGRNGKNGRIGSLEKRMGYTNRRVDDVDNRIDELEKFALKLALKLAVSTFAGGSLVAGVLKLIG